MSLAIKRSTFVILIILSIIWYGIYVSLYPAKFENFEFDNPRIWIIHTKMRSVYSFVTGKSIYIWNKSKELYDSKVTPKVDSVSNEIKSWIDSTKDKIDTVRKTLSWAEQTIDKAWKAIEDWKNAIEWATEVFSDVNKMSEWITNSVNKNIMQ